MHAELYGLGRFVVSSRSRGPRAAVIGCIDARADRTLRLALRNYSETGIAVAIMRIPQDPAIRVSVVGPSNLGGNFTRAKSLSAESIIAECLEPWTKLLWIYASSQDAVLQRQVNDLVDILVGRHGTSVSGDAELKARGIKHRTNVVDQSHDTFKLLANPRIVEVPSDIAEDVDRQECIVGS